MSNSENDSFYHVADTKWCNYVIQNAYNDIIHEPAKTISVAIEQLVSVLKLITFPMAAAGMTSDYLKNKLSNFFEKSLRKVDKNNKIYPDIGTTYSIIQNVTRVFEKKELEEAYSWLLASASDKRKKDSIHPAFAQIILELSPLDVIVLNWVKKQKLSPFLETIIASKDDMYSYPIVLMEPFILIEGYEDNYEEISSSLSNLFRLNLIKRGVAVMQPTEDNQYERIFKSNVYKDIRNALPDIKSGKYTETKVVHGTIRLTSFGQKFMRTCSE